MDGWIDGWKHSMDVEGSSQDPPLWQKTIEEPLFFKHSDMRENAISTVDWKYIKANIWNVEHVILGSSVFTKEHLELFLLFISFVVFFTSSRFQQKAEARQK